jgi:hypothetical protein
MQHESIEKGRARTSMQRDDKGLGLCGYGGKGEIMRREEEARETLATRTQRKKGRNKIEMGKGDRVERRKGGAMKRIQVKDLLHKPKVEKRTSPPRH